MGSSRCCWKDFSYELCVGQNGRVWLVAPTARETVLLLQALRGGRVKGLGFTTAFAVSRDQPVFNTTASFLCIVRPSFWGPSKEGLMAVRTPAWTAEDPPQAIKRSFGMTNVQIEARFQGFRAWGFEV